MFTMLCVLLLFFLVDLSEERKIVLQLKNFIPDVNDIQLTGAVALDQHPDYYITAFHPKLSYKLHHFAIYGTGELVSPILKRGDVVSYQNGVNNSETDADFRFAHFLYGSMPKTGPLVLPKDVSYLTGWNTRFKYLLYHMHYNDKRDGLPDKSKVVITYQTRRTKYTALHIGGHVPAGTFAIPKQSTAVANLIIKLSIKMWPLFILFHTHRLGTLGTGYWVKHNASNPEADQWTKLSSRNPQLPQIFDPVETNGPMMPGDLFVGRCHYYNPGDTDRRLGIEEENEMCDINIIFAVNYHTISIHQEYLQSPQEYGLKNMPEDA